MILQNILTKSIEILNLQGEIDLKVDSDKRKQLISAANTVITELTAAFIQLKTSEEVDVDDKRLYFSDLKLRPREILAIEDINGNDIRYKIYPTYIELGSLSPTVKVRYVYFLENLELTNDVDLPPKFNLIVMATGVASEYCYVTGMLEEAIFHKNRYEKYIDSLVKPIKVAFIKKRSFLNDYI